MYNYIISALAAISTSIYLIDMAQFHRKFKLDFKPFNCVMCFSVWSFIVLILTPSYIPLLLLFATFTGVAAAVISKLLSKL